MGKRDRRRARARKAERRQARLEAGVTRRGRRSPIDAERARAILARRCDERSAPLARFSDDDELRRLLGPLVVRVRELAPKIIEDALLHLPLVLLAVRAPCWVRPLATWRPLGKSRRTQLDSLVDHLLVKWPVPRFLYGVFHDGPTRSVGVDLFVHLAQGGSLQQALDRDLLPAVLNRAARHAFLRTTGSCTVMEAIRRAQVRSFGGAHTTASELLNTFLGRELVDDAFWSRVIQWICERGQISAGGLGHALDRIRAARARNPSLSPSGRTLAGIVREPEPEPELRVAHARVDATPYRSSGFGPGEWMLDDPGGSTLRESWTITELTDKRELAIEGATLHHCVLTYDDRVRSGGCSIWSLRRDGTRRLTIEVWNASRRVVQIRGRKNRAPRDHELSLVMRWADANGLQVTASAR